MNDSRYGLTTSNWTEDIARSELKASRPGWFPTVSELHDHRRGRRVSADLPAPEWRSTQWLWARDTAVRNWTQSLAS